MLFRSLLGQMAVSAPCAKCAGEGQIIEKPCTACRGDGRAKGNKRLRVDIPPGVSDGTQIRLSGQGEAGRRGGPPGNLYVVVGVREHPQLARDGITEVKLLQEHLHDLSGEVRTGYRMLIVTTWAAALSAALAMASLGILTYRWVFRPLRLLGHGSRRVAAGD